VSPGTGCTASAYCITADATSTSSPVSHAGAGLLEATTAVKPSQTSSLGLTSWRVVILPTSTGLDYSEYDAARAAGASSVTVIISDAWFWASNSGCGVPSLVCGATPPWQEPAVYSQWVTAYVKQIESTGRHADYWDIQNEPDAAVGAGGYYSTSGASTVTPANDMLQFDIAYNAIRTADPAAGLEGPSLSEFRTLSDPSRLDMGTFLSYSAAHNLQWNAVSWHENGGYLNSDAWNWLPSVKIPADVAAVRSLLAQYPTLGSPALVVNEFGQRAVPGVPGWYAGELDALESSGVSSADRTCRYTLTAPTSPGGCTNNPTNLDELLTSTGGTSGDYQVLEAYAQLAGSRIATATSDDSFSALGAIDGSGTVRMLVGRHYSCTAAVNPDCQQPVSATPPPTSVPLTVRVPWTGMAQVTLARIPDTPGKVVSAPQVVQTSSVTVSGGSVVLTLPSVADGEAWTVTITPGTTTTISKAPRAKHK
jgi:hypothetical protein